MKSLHLHVKTVYFDQIKSGEKTEEYRIQNQYWGTRLLDFKAPYGPIQFAKVIIYNAYKAGLENRIEFPWRGWELKEITHPHFGNVPKLVYAIKLEK